jgi:type IV pilus assembly protein PilA
MMRKLKGFTLIELIVVIGIIAILAAIVIVAVNPQRQFALGRNTARRSDVNAILNAIHQHAADNNGVLATDVTGATTAACIGTDAACVDLTDELVTSANYISAVPKDPSVGTDANTGYTVQYNATSKRVTIAAPNAELSQSISLTK